MKIKNVDLFYKVCVDAFSKEDFIERLNKGNIVVPTTGGLDSRFAAGILTKEFGYQIPWTYWFRCPDNSINEPHIKRIAEILKTELVIVDVPSLPAGFRLGMDNLNGIKYLSDFRVLVALHMDVKTGMLKCKSHERKYFLDTFKEMEINMNYVYGMWGGIERPLDNTRLIGFLLSLPRSERLFQNLYIQAINKYLPDLALVPRCFEKGTGSPTPINLGMTTYIKYRLYERIVRWMRK